MNHTGDGNRDRESGTQSEHAGIRPWKPRTESGKGCQKQQEGFPEHLRSKENMGLLGDKGQGWILNAFFAWVFSTKTSLHESQAPETVGMVEEGRCTLGGRGTSQGKLDIHKSMGHSQWVLWELAGDFLKSLSIMLGCSQQLCVVPKDWRKAKHYSNPQEG